MWPIQQNQVTKLVHVQVKKKQALLFVGSLSKNLWTRFKTTPLYSCSWGLLLLPAMLYYLPLLGCQPHEHGDFGLL